MKKCNLSEEAQSHLWNARCHWAGINVGFNGYIDSAAVLFLTVENDVNSFACHCCETINTSVIMVGKLLIFFSLWYLICSAQWGDELGLINRSHDSVSNWRIIISLPQRCPQLKPLTALFQTGHKGLNEYSCDFAPSLTKGSTYSVFVLYIVSCNCWIEVQDQSCFPWKSQ